MSNGNQNIELEASNKYYVGEDLEANIVVKSKKDSSNLDSLIKTSLLDSNKKKVKSVKSKLKINGKENIHLAIPENLNEGTYYLKVEVSSKRGNDVIIKPITISNHNTENITCFLDKGIYKPGDTVNYRILSTYKNNDKPIEEDLTINIYDGNENKVYSKNVKTSNYGIVSGNFTLANEVNSGSYKIETISNKSKYSKSFIVNPYVTPQFEAKIETNKDYYKTTETASITVNTKYFFGEPVKNAKVALEINGKKQEGITDNDGKFVYEYKYLAETVETKIDAYVTDESNYMVEAHKKIYFSDTPYKIEVLPENGNVIKNVDNKIYFISKNLDGTPVKTYMNIKIGNKTSRQVITDDNGVGVLVLNKSDLELKTLNNNKQNNSNYNNSKTKNNTYLELKISAKNMQGDIVVNTQNLNVQENSGILINTDKVKYLQGEDIKINLNSSSDILSTTLAVCKGDKIIKFITTDSNDAIINLSDEYGIIDIYIVNGGRTTNKRTIFVKPQKKLDIGIKLEKTEFQPKENLKMDFSLKDENEKTVDGALLVSILDEANLAISPNDLSIDKIKLCLSDIKFTEDIDATTLYANIIDDKSESALMAVLLRQENNNPNINLVKTNSIDMKDNARVRLIIGVGVFISIFGIALAIKYKKFGSFIKMLITICAVFISIVAIIKEDITPLKAIASFIISVVISVTMLKEYKDMFSKWFVEYIFVFILIAILMFTFNEYGLAWGIIALLVEGFVLLYVADKLGKKFKIEFIRNMPQEVLKRVIVLIVAVFIRGITFVLLENWIDEDAFYTIIGLIVFFGLNFLFEIHSVKKEPKSDNNTVTIQLKKSIIKAIGIAISIIAIFVGISIYENTRRPIYNSYLDITDSVSSEHSSHGMLTPGSIKSNIEYGDSSSSGESVISSIFEKATDLFDSKNTKQSAINMEEDDDNFSTQEENKTENLNVEEKQENIRNVFLESLCFIPELITNDGKASTNLKLSDNITTWKIQVVGNTQNGNIGYNYANFAVKKDFFIDYTLPTNCVIGDDIKIPVTIYNYTQGEINCGLSVMEKDWFTLGKYAENVTVAARSTKMVYVPITIKKTGNNIFSISANVGDMQDIVQKNMTVQNNGIKKTNVVSSGSMEKSLSQDIIYDVKAIENTKNLKVKLYPSMISQAIEGLDSIFKMPTGCFEQTASSLYPDIVALKYMEDNKIINDDLKKKALDYIAAGYQRALTYEVPSEKGGFSLYGHSPANPILTAYGLMELQSAKSVYPVDENVLIRMKEYLYKKQGVNGSYNIGNSYSSVVSSSNSLTLSTYIIWALTEADAKDTRIEKSVKYVEDNLDKMSDSYTMALAANIFANTGDTKQAKNILTKLCDRLKVDQNNSYLESTITDYYGTRGNAQNVQTSALASIAMSKLNDNSFNKTNANLINYIISKKDSNGNWYTTQATIFALKALIEYQSKSDISNQTIKVTLNGDKKEFKIDENALDLYEANFEGLGIENNLKIEAEKGKIFYEIVEEYYQDIETAKEFENNKIEVTSTIPQTVKLNELTSQQITIKNNSGAEIINGMLEISIPQGFKVQEETLSKLVANGTIEKYEYNYSKIYLYLQNFKKGNNLNLLISYRPMYPGDIKGASLRCYDYYNPDVEGISMPVEINITE